MTNNNDSQKEAKQAIAISGSVLGLAVAFVVIEAGKNNMEGYKTLRMLETKGQIQPMNGVKPAPWAVVVTHPIGQVSTIILGGVLGAFIAYKIADHLIRIVDDCLNFLLRKRK